MELGTVLLYLTLALGVGTFIVSILHLRTKEDRFRTLARYLVLICFVFVTITFLLLAFYFLTSDLHIEYVHDYTDKGYAWYYKLTGVWAGEKGTILLWTWFISLSFVLAEFLHYRRLKKESAQSKQKEDQNSEGKKSDTGLGIFDWIRTIVMIVLVAFILFLIRIDMFKVTDPLALAFFPDGRGLNPLLVTPFMIVHPVLEFAAYALTVIPLAAALSFLITNDKKWSEISILWSRLAWLFYTLAIGIGALWAYTVLGWGGYWAWDPVETANLIPWIALTAFLHAQAYNRKKRQYIFMAPLLAVIVFVLTIFATFETRSGYVVSVLHAFTGPTAGILDPGEKLVTILRTNEGVSFFMILMLAVLIVAAILFIWRFAKIRQQEGRSKSVSKYFPYAYIIFLIVLLAAVLVDVASSVSFSLTVANVIGMGNEGIGLAVLVLILIGIPIVWILLTSEEKDEEEVEEKETLSGKISKVINDKNLMFVTIVILSIWFLTTILLMLMGVGGLEPAVFDDRLPLILVPLLIVLTVCLTWRYLGRLRSLVAIFILVLAAVIGYAVIPNRVVGIYVAVMIVVLVASCYKIIRIALPRKAKIDKLKVGGILLVVAGIIGMVMWSNPARILMFSVSVDLPWELAPLGFIAAVLALIGGLSALRTLNLKLSLLGAIFGILSIGYLFSGAILSIIALILIATSSAAFTKRRTSRTIRPVMRTVGSYIIHLGIAFLVIGYVSSNYLAEEKDFNPSSAGSLIKGIPVQFRGYQIQIEGSDGSDTNGDGLYETIEVRTVVLRNGGEIGTATMQLYWMIPANPAEAPHYMINVYVLSTSIEDIYFIGYAFNTQNDGWIQAMEDTGRQFSSDDVQEVAFQIKALPLMSALWGGMWIMAAGITFIIGTDYISKKRRPAPERKKIEKKEETEEVKEVEDLKAEEEYEKALKDELEKLEGEE